MLTLPLLAKLLPVPASILTAPPTLVPEPPVALPAFRFNAPPVTEVVPEPLPPYILVAAPLDEAPVEVPGCKVRGLPAPEATNEVISAVWFPCKVSTPAFVTLKLPVDVFIRSVNPPAP